MSELAESSHRYNTFSSRAQKGFGLASSIETARLASIVVLVRSLVGGQGGKEMWPFLASRLGVDTVQVLASSSCHQAALQACQSTHAHTGERALLRRSEETMGLGQRLSLLQGSAWCLTLLVASADTSNRETVAPTVPSRHA